MKNVIFFTEKVEELFVIENVNKTTIAEVAKVSSAIDLGNKHSWVISNANIDITKDLGLTGMQKYKRCAGQIQDKVDSLHKN